MPKDTHSDSAPAKAEDAAETSDSNLSSADSVPNTPNRQSVCSEGEEVKPDAASEGTAESAADQLIQSLDEEQPGSSAASEQDEEEQSKDASSSASEDTHTSDITQSENEPAPSVNENDKGAPVPVARSFSRQKKVEEAGDDEKAESAGVEELKTRKEAATSQNTDNSNPPGFLYKVQGNSIVLLFYAHF